MKDQSDDYDGQLEWLFHQFPVFQKVGHSAYKPTLDNTNELIRQFGLDLDKLKFVHVAGTNGKGTTASIMASTFTESGLKTGLFTSPHIHDFRERIRINGEMIEKNEVSRFITAVKNQDFIMAPSFFEISWVMALLHFQREECDVVVVETGLGGRLDATNVITPILSVITNIGLDHTSILGNTLGEIAKEKAGIIKKGVPVVIGQSLEETRSVFNIKAEEEGAEICFVNHPRKSTTFQINEKIAKEALQKVELPSFKFDASIFGKALERLSKNTGYKGRFQKISKSPLIIADAAHNMDGIQRLIKDVDIQFQGKQIHAVYGASNDKDLERILSLVPHKWIIHFTEFENQRSFHIDKLKDVAESFLFNSTFHKNSSEALAYAQSIINKDDVILVFGSFFLLEEII